MNQRTFVWIAVVTASTLLMLVVLSLFTRSSTHQEEAPRVTAVTRAGLPKKMETESTSIASTENIGAGGMPDVAVSSPQAIPRHVVTDSMTWIEPPAGLCLLSAVEYPGEKRVAFVSFDKEKGTYIGVVWNSETEEWTRVPLSQRGYEPQVESVAWGPNAQTLVVMDNFIDMTAPGPGTDPQKILEARESHQAWSIRSVNLDTGNSELVTDIPNQNRCAFGTAGDGSLMLAVSQAGEMEVRQYSPDGTMNARTFDAPDDVQNLRYAGNSNQLWGDKYVDGERVPVVGYYDLDYDHPTFIPVANGSIAAVDATGQKIAINELGPWTTDGFKYDRLVILDNGSKNRVFVGDAADFARPVAFTGDLAGLYLSGFRDGIYIPDSAGAGEVGSRGIYRLSMKTGFVSRGD